LNSISKIINGDAHLLPGTPRGEATYHLLRQAILSCTVAPGSTLTEASVMEQYQVGKSTCRLALARLAQEGFVRSIPRQGYIVTPVTLTDVEEVFALRLLLEPAAAKMAAGKADIRTLKHIESVARTNKASRNAGNRIGFFLDANREFHLSVAMASGNGRLVQSISSLLDEMKRLVALGFVEQGHSPEIAHDHEELIEALREGDGARAEQVVIRHISTFRDMTLDKVMQSIRAHSESLPLTNVRAADALK
jgi:DNA-binding GntR family transcriptional regulator